MDKKALALRIFISSTDKTGTDLLSEKLVFLAKEKKLAGATVLKGILGYGASSIIHSYKFWEVQDKVPLVVEIIDEEGKIKAFFEEISSLLNEMRYGCMVTTEEVKIKLYKSGEKKK
jgi:uncharacterized protein